LSDRSSESNATLISSESASSLSSSFFTSLCWLEWGEDGGVVVGAVADDEVGVAVEVFGDAGGKQRAEVGVGGARSTGSTARLRARNREAFSSEKAAPRALRKSTSS
jgi:hypothetical protein